MHYIRLKTQCAVPLNKSNGWCTCIGYRLQGSITWLSIDSVLDIYSVTPNWSRRTMSAGREGASKWTACDWLDLHSCLSCHGKSHTYKDTKRKQPYKHTFKHSHSKESYAIFSLFSVALMRIMWLMACSYLYLCVLRQHGDRLAWWELPLLCWKLRSCGLYTCLTSLPAPVTSFGNQLEHMCVWWGREYMHTSVKRSEKESNDWHKHYIKQFILELFNCFCRRDLHLTRNSTNNNTTIHILNNRKYIQMTDYPTNKHK